MLVLSTAPPRVLVVDDDFDTREALSTLLQYCGYSVVAAGNGQEALSCLRTSSLAAIGIIILDLMMPVMDGWEFLEQQSRDAALAQIPVIIVTATPSQRPVPAKAVLTKPVQFDSLVQTINRYLPAAV
jgi:CheY-like chemotaxis protein